MKTETAADANRNEIDVAAWVAYLEDLERIVRAEIPAERWEMAFRRTDTPAQAAGKLAGYLPAA